MRVLLRCSVPLLAALVCCGCERHSGDADHVVKTFGAIGLAPGLFSYPRSVNCAPDGTVFVVDKSGRVQRFSPDGEYHTGWTMPEKDAGKPVGLAVHPDGRVFIADTHYHRVMVHDRDGHVLASFGSEGFGDGQFQLPTDVAFDHQGFIYVSEYNGNDRISQWSPDLKFVRAFGAEPIDGQQMRRPCGLIVDDEDTIWTADACNHRLVRFDRDGRVLRTFGEFGTAPGQMRYPYDLSLAPDGSILVCEYEGARLQWFSKDGRSLRVWGRHGRGPGELFAPWSAAYGPNGRVYVVDSLNNRVQIVQP